MPIPKNTKIVCPNCDREIAMTIVDLHIGSTIMQHYFRWLNKPYKTDELAVCKKCKAPWFMEGQLHTDKGWVGG